MFLLYILFIEFCLCENISNTNSTSNVEWNRTGINQLSLSLAKRRKNLMLGKYGWND